MTGLERGTRFGGNGKVLVLGIVKAYPCQLRCDSDIVLGAVDLGCQGFDIKFDHVFEGGRDRIYFQSTTVRTFLSGSGE